MRQLALMFVFVISSCCVVHSQARAGNEVYLGNKVSSQKSMNDVDHSAWDKLLQKYVDQDGRVNYRSWKASPADVRALDDYLLELSAASRQVPATRNAKLSFWINAYNSVTVRGILREYPTTSIRNHTANLWGYNIWKDLQLYIDAKPFSLNEMEGQLLKKIVEPRVHFAVVCASIGCPRLLNRAYVPDRVQQQLEENAKDFFSRRQNFRYDKANQRFYLSTLLDWYGTDFGRDKKSQLRRFADWLPTAEAIDAAKRGNVSVSYLDYDWNLNTQ